jgi:phosphohistidine swiveling domain-containing protein
MGTTWFADHTPSASFPIYSRANCAEVFPDPVSPLTMDYSWPGAGDAGLRRWMFRFCVDPAELDDHQNIMFEVYNAYMFINASVSRLMGARLPGMTVDMVDAAYFGTETQMPAYIPREQDNDPAIREMAGNVALGFMVTTAMPPAIDELRDRVDEFVASRPDLSTVPSEELLARLRATGPMFDEIFELHSEASTASGIVLGAISAITAELGQPGLDARIVSGIGNVDSAAPSWDLWDLSRMEQDSPAFENAFREFTAQFGSRGPNEWEMRSPCWETSPLLVHTLIDRMREAPDEAAPAVGHERARAMADAAIASTRDALAGNEEALDAFEAALIATRVWTAARERTKTTIVKVAHEGRLAALELGARLAADGQLNTAAHVFMLRDAELEEAMAGVALAEECARREAQFVELAQVEPPFVWSGNPPPLEEWPLRNRPDASADAHPGEAFVGMGGSAGRFTGRARAIADPSEGGAFEPGEILVAPLTDPSWTPLFVPAGAVVVDVGAMMSHAVIVSRELGIPCVVAVVDASRRIPDGATITVDGDTGTVTVDAI